MRTIQNFNRLLKWTLKTDYKICMEMKRAQINQDNHKE